MAKKNKGQNWGWWIAALVLMTIGIWALASGFISHLRAADALSMSTARAVAPWYFGGLLALGLGKLAKCKAYGWDWKK